jgi:hypothetical protein
MIKTNEKTKFKLLSDGQDYGVEMESGEGFYKLRQE